MNTDPNSPAFLKEQALKQIETLFPNQNIQSSQSDSACIFHAMTEAGLPVEPMDLKTDSKQLVLFVLAGSRAYGRNTPESDLDLRGVFLPGLSEILLQKEQDTLELEAPEDTVLFSLAKFFRLAAAGNPNVLEWLFVCPEHVFFASDWGCRILENRSLFLTQRMLDSYLGYAAGSWKQLIKWMDQEGTVKNSDSFLRHKMEKHASHIERLLVQLLEALQTGTFSTWNPEKTPPFLPAKPRESKQSSSARMMFNPAYLNRLKSLNEQIARAQKKTRLPEYVDMEKLNCLRASIVKDYICSQLEAESKKRSVRQELNGRQR